MQHVPLSSIITLITELGVTVSVFSIVIRAYKTGVFMRGFAFVVLGYEVIFNITYMLSRLMQGLPSGAPVVYSPYETILAIFHGTFSLVMFIALVTFFLFAARGYRRGNNFFQDHHTLTRVFLVSWSISIISGVAFFIALYVV